MKEEEALRLVNSFNFSADKAYPLKNEASGRVYWRATNQSESIILCFLDPSIGNHNKFIDISEQLSANDISGVKVLHHDEKLGITIQNDLGDNDLLKVLDENNKQELLNKSLDLLIDIQNIQFDNIDKFKSEDLKEQMNLFKTKFCEEFLSVETNNSIDELIEIVNDELMMQPWKNCHFDFERRNLILNHDRTISVIDYQDIKTGPIGIDLSGILVDHYYPFEEKNVINFVDYYAKKTNFNTNEAFKYLKSGCIQRNLRILGTLSDLYISQKRTFRLKDLPMILKNTITILETENFPTDFFNDVLEKLTSRLNSI